MQLNDLLRNTSVFLEKGIREDVCSVERDSRKVKEGSLFAAVSGYQEDGKKFIPEALQKGAKAILTETMVRVPENVHLCLSKNVRRDFSLIARNFYGKVDRKLKLFGVTGTNGKTSVVHLLYHIFCAAGKLPGLFSTIQNRWGDRQEEAELTTPDALYLNERLNIMCQQGIDACFLEASSQGIDQDRLSGINFRGKILTGVTSDHLDYHETQEKYETTKYRFLVEDDSPVYLNLDDHVGLRVARTKKPKLSFAIENSEADLIATDIESSMQGLHFRLHFKDRCHIVNCPNLIGEFNVYNIMAAACLALAENISWEDILTAVRCFAPPKGRLTKVFDKKFRVYIDYAHTADGLEKILKTLRPIVKGKLRLLFGCGGGRDKLKRSEMGRVAREYSDYIYLTSDNPRYESQEVIINDILSGIHNKENCLLVSDRREAIFKAVVDCMEGDILVVAGKGHEEYLEIMGSRLPFSDFDVIKEGLNSRGDIDGIYS